MVKEKKIMVSVDMITYGHENYIKKAIEGVLMQETNFDFELIIADDCSPDNTQKIVEDIIKSHPRGNKIKYFRHKKNLGMAANGSFAVAQCSGKYIAICEGDDYWTDPRKLQEQVDFLEKNPDVGLVHSDFNLLDDNSKKIILGRKKKGIKCDHFTSLLTGKYVIATLTVCFRREIYRNYINDIDPNSKNWLMGDLPLWLYISHFSKLHYMDKVTSVYRVLGESASNTKNIDRMMKFELNVKEVKLFFLLKYCPNNYKVKNQIESFYIYRKIIANIELEGKFEEFVKLEMQFHKINRSPKLFFGSLKQIMKKVSA